MMGSANAWSPLLSGHSAARARHHVGTIARMLERSTLVGLNPSHQPRRASEEHIVNDSISLGSGITGIALFLGEFTARSVANHPTTSDRCASSGTRSAARRLFDDALSAAGDRELSASLYGGLGGIAWVGEYLRRCECVDLESDWADELDASLAAVLVPMGRDHTRDTIRQGARFDLISGVSGMGVYLLTRPATTMRDDTVRAAAATLARAADKAASGAAWFYPPEQLDGYRLAATPDGYWDPGVAHGSAGVLAFLGALEASGAGDEASQSLRRATRDWIRDLVDRAPPGPSLLPTAVTPSGVYEPSRLAWCYGDLGVAATLAAVGTVLADDDCIALAERLADSSSARRGVDTGVWEPSLCHGSAGAAHLFARLYQHLRAPSLRDAACFWYERTFDLLEKRPFVAPTLEGPREAAGSHDMGFLTGAAGVGLALLASVTDREPSWDALLGCSLADTTVCKL